MRKLYPPKMSLIHHSKAFLWVQRTVEVFLISRYMIHESAHVVIFMSVRPLNELTKKRGIFCLSAYFSFRTNRLFTGETSEGGFLKILGAKPRATPK